MKSVKSNSGFTLVELLVVLAITAFLLTITASFVHSGVTGNYRASCQVNFHKIHQALVQYMLDHDDAPPPFDPTMPSNVHPCASSPGWQGGTSTITYRQNRGLFALYKTLEYPRRQPAGFTLNDPSMNYVQGMKVLHCPEDFVIVNGQRDPHASQCPRDPAQPTSILGITLNPDWISYQVVDPTTSEWTYAPFRLYTVNNINNVRAHPNYRRQLAVPAACYDNPTALCPSGGCWDPSAGRCVTYSQALSANRLELLPKWHPADDTVVAWCIFHRNRARPSNYDNVLFWDGSVEFLPAEQQPEGTCTNTRAGADRLPELKRRRECGLP